MTLYRQARAFLDANYELYGAFNAGDIGATIAALGAVADANIAIEDDDAMYRIHDIWDTFYGRRIQYNAWVTFMRRGDYDDSNDTVEANALFNVFSEPGLTHVDLSVNSIQTPALTDDVVVAVSGNDGEAAPDHIADIITALAEWTRLHAEKGAEG